MSSDASTLCSACQGREGFPVGRAIDGMGRGADGALNCAAGAHPWAVCLGAKRSVVRCLHVVCPH